MQKKSGKTRKRWVLIGVLILIIAGAGGTLVVLPRLQANAASGATTYRTQALAKGSLSSTVSATGNVYTRQAVALSWQTSGIVSQVLVAKGEQVTAGAVLATLDPALLPQVVLNAQNDLAAAQRALDDLLNSTTARANAQLALINAEQALQTAQKAAQSKQFQRASEETIAVANANLIQAKDALDKAEQIYNQAKHGDTNSVQYANALAQYAAAEQKANTAQMNLNYVTSLPDPLTIQKANAELEVAEANYADARRAWERVKDGPNPQDVAAAEAKVAAAQAVIDQAQITAPISGTVTAINTQPGDLVSAQSPGFQINDLSHLYTDISVSEVDINQVKTGQPVAISFDAISNKTYAGKVIDIAEIGSSSSGGVNYTVTVELTDPDEQVKPGMTASADVTVMQVTDVLLVPASALRTVGGRQVVYVLENGAPRAVPVTIGQTSETASQVTGGLQEGALIVLNPPSAASAANSTAANRGPFGGLFGGLLGGGVRVTGGNFPGGGPGDQGGFSGPSGGNNPNSGSGGGSNSSSGSGPSGPAK